MMDTVWIRLTAVVLAENQPSTEQEEHFMFGPTGIVRFKTQGNKTLLFNSAKALQAEVTEDSAFIMDILRKMRGTEGRLDDKQKKATKSKRTSSKNKASRKSKANTL